MKKLALWCISMLMVVCTFAQEKPRRDTVPLQKKTRQPPDTSFKNPIYKGPAEIDSINKSDSLKGGARTAPLNRYREDSVPKAPRIN